MTVMRVMLFVWEVTMLREYEGDGNASVGAGRCCCSECGMSVCECGMSVCEWYTWFMSCVDNVLAMNVVRGVRGEGGVVTCVCVWLGVG